MGPTASFSICFRILCMCVDRNCYHQIRLDGHTRPCKVLTFSLQTCTNGNSMTSQSPQKVNFIERGTAVFRYALYRSPKWLYGCEPTAAAIIVALSIYTLIWLLAVHPYYTDQCWQSGSPDLSVRAGWFSLSTTPFVFILASKKNPVSILTKIPYEKLNVYHRCTSP